MRLIDTCDSHKFFELKKIRINSISVSCVVEGIRCSYCRDYARKMYYLCDYQLEVPEHDYKFFYICRECLHHLKKECPEYFEQD